MVSWPLPHRFRWSEVSGRTGRVRPGRVGSNRLGPDLTGPDRAGPDSASNPGHRVSNSTAAPARSATVSQRNSPEMADHSPVTMVMLFCVLLWLPPEVGVGDVVADGVALDVGVGEDVSVEDPPPKLDVAVGEGVGEGVGVSSSPPKMMGSSSGVGVGEGVCVPSFPPDVWLFESLVEVFWAPFGVGVAVELFPPKRIPPSPSGVGVGDGEDEPEVGVPAPDCVAVWVPAPPSDGASVGVSVELMTGASGESDPAPWMPATTARPATNSTVPTRNRES